MENKSSGIQLKRILLVFGFALAVLFFMDLNNRITVLYQKDTQRDKMRVELYQLMMTNDQLKTQIAYATSDLAVEQWARTEGHWVKDGDVPIYPMPVDGSDTDQKEESVAEQKVYSNWDIWKQVLFGN